MIAGMDRMAEGRNWWAGGGRDGSCDCGGLRRSSGFGSARASAKRRGCGAKLPPIRGTGAEGGAGFARQLVGTSPTLDGFVDDDSLRGASLDKYQRGFYQCVVQVASAGKGGVVVHVTVNIMAWYAAADASKAGYKTLTSNGRLESDYLDRLEQVLGGGASADGGFSPADAPNSASTSGVTARPNACRQRKCDGEKPAKTNSPAAGPPAGPAAGGAAGGQRRPVRRIQRSIQQHSSCAAKPRNGIPRN